MLKLYCSKLKNSKFIAQNPKLMSFIFPKKEHLCGEKNITELFKSGNAFVIYPLRVVFLLEENKKEKPLIQVLVSVPKKRHKRANVRNRLKRLMRESYRLNNTGLKTILEKQNLQLSVAFQYISDDVFEFAPMQIKMKQALKKLEDKAKEVIVSG